MENEYKAYKDRRTDRIKNVAIFLISWILYFSVAVLFDYVNFELVYAVMVVVGVIGIYPAIFVFYSRYWISEKHETKIFVNLYKALDILQLYSEKKEESRIYLSKGAKRVRKAITELDKLCRGIDAVNSALSDKEIGERLEKVRKNLENRILPRIIQGKEIPKMKSTLRDMAEVFGEVVPIGLDKIVSLNKNLESYDEVTLREKTFKSAFEAVMTSKPTTLVFSILLGYLSAVAIIFFFCQILQMDLIRFMRDNLAAVISVGAVISGMFAAVFVLKR